MLRVKVHGSYRKIGEWGCNFGPLSNVDQAIPDSGGVTLRDLMEAGEIRRDCFEEVDEPEAFVPPADDEHVEDEQEG